MILLLILFLSIANAYVDLSSSAGNTKWTVRCSTDDSLPIPPNLNATKMATYLKLVNFATL
jgi:hypothetical protein